MDTTKVVSKALISACIIYLIVQSGIIPNGIKFVRNRLPGNSMTAFDLSDLRKVDLPIELPIDFVVSKPKRKIFKIPNWFGTIFTAGKLFFKFNKNDRNDPDDHFKPLSNPIDDNNLDIIDITDWYENWD